MREFRPHPDALTDWRVIASPQECYIEGAGLAPSSRTGKLMDRRCIIRFSETAADTWFGRWTLKIAPRHQEHRIKAHRPRDAEEFRYVRAIVETALSQVSNEDLQVWSEGRAPHIDKLRAQLLGAISV